MTLEEATLIHLMIDGACHYYGELFVCKILPNRAASVTLIDLPGEPSTDEEYCTPLLQLLRDTGFTVQLQHAALGCGV